MNFWQDLRLAARRLAKNRGFTLVAMLTMALGIGSSAAIYSVVNTLLVRPLPYRDVDRIVQIVSHRRDGDTPVRSPTMAQRYFVGLRERTQTLSALGSYDSFSNLTGRRLAVTIDGNRGSTELLGTRISPQLLSMLGAHTVSGRFFETVEEQVGRNNVILLSWRAWRVHFGGNPEVLGSLLTLDNRAYAVIGVMAPEFEFPDRQTDFWIPLTPAPVPPPAAARSDSANSAYADAVFGRLKEGLPIQTAAAEVESILRELDLEFARERSLSTEQTGFPRSMPRRSEVVSMQDELVASARPLLWVLSGAVAFVLLIAVANVVNLLLGGTASRQREVAIRRALGAGRVSLVRQALIETLLLALAGGFLGIGLAYWIVETITALAPADVPLPEVGLDLPIVSYSVILSLSVGVAVGLVLAWAIFKKDPSGTLTKHAPTATTEPGLVRLRKLLVVAQIAMAMTLLVGAVLLIRSFVALTRVNPGYDPRGVLTFQVALPSESASDSRGFYREVLTRLESVPFVEAAGATDVLPIAGASSFHLMLAGLPTPPGPGDSMVMRVVSQDYFRAMGIRLLEGRSFSDTNVSEARGEILVSREFSRRYFAGRNSIGMIVGGSVPYEVVGIVDDVRHEGLHAEAQPEYYVDLRQFGLAASMRPYFVVRSSRNALELAPTLRTLVRQIDPQAEVGLNIATMTDIVSESIARPRFNASLLGGFAAIAFALAVIAIYAVMAYYVAHRTREIGVRVALGASPSDVINLVLRQGVAMTAVGIGLGLVCAAAVTRYLESMLFGLTPLDATTFLGTSLAFAGTAVLASFLPARRAARIDPVIALRCE